jgi:hypothetical protein
VEQDQKNIRYKRTWPRGPRARRSSFNLEQAQHIAAILGVVIALGTGILGLVTFRYSTNVQAEDAAYRVLSDHYSLRLEQIKELDDPTLMDDLVEHPEYLIDRERVSEPDAAIYTGVAEHGISIAEQIYITRRNDEGWRSTSRAMIWQYRALFTHRRLLCGTFKPDFIEFISETLEKPPTDICLEEAGEISGP